MDPVDVRLMIDKARKNATQTGASSEALVPEEPAEAQKEAAEIEDLMRQVDEQIELEELGEFLRKKAAVERRTNLTMAKLLAAVDVFSEVRR